MKMLSSDTTRLLDKLYNLRGETSVVLVSMDRERESAEQTRDKTSALKAELQERIGELTAEETVLADEGEKLKRALSNIKKSEFSTVIDHLHIEFDPEAIKRKVENTLPLTLEKVASEKKKAGEELVKVEDEMNEAITKIEELGIRRDEALANQDKLNKYFELALSSNINITRDEITSLLSQFEFTDEEQREAAKLMMFPEDGLFLYDKAFNGRPGSSSDLENPEEIEAVEETPVEEEKNEESKPLIDDIIIEEPRKEDKDETITLAESSRKEESKPEVKVEPEKAPAKEDLVNTLTTIGFDYLDFTNNDFNKMKEHFDAKTFKENVKIMENIGINKDVFLDNIELLYDKEIKAKIDTLIKVGKQPQDIYLNPNVLVKYTLEELNTAIKMLHDSGLEPKNVPLMAY